MALAVITVGVIPILLSTAQVARTQYAYRQGRADMLQREDLFSYASWCEMRQVPFGHGWKGVITGAKTKIFNGTYSVGAASGASVGELVEPSVAERSRSALFRLVSEDSA